MLRAILAFAILLAATTAHADWQFTKWGMSTESLEAFGQGNITRIPAGAQAGLKVIGLGNALLESGYKAQEITFETIYYFADNKLTAVSLKTKSTEDGIKTRNRLEALYGKPDRKEIIAGMTLTRWRSEGDGNMITFYEYAIDMTKGMYEVRYEPVPSKGGGL